MTDTRAGREAGSGPSAPSSEDAQVDPSRTTSSFSRVLRNIGTNYGVVVFWLLLIIIFTLVLPNLFPTVQNVQAITAGQAVPGVAALAVLFPLSAGEFDLSIGGIIGITAAFTAWVGPHGIGFPLDLVIALAIGAGVGLFNAWLVVKIGISAFIATLGVSSILAGGELLITNNAVLFSGIPPSLSQFGQLTFLKIPGIFWYFLGLAIVVWIVLEHTPYGRYVRATGFGRTAARLVGVRTDAYLASTFVISGTICALAGVMETGRVASATPTSGPEFLLPAYAAAFLGASTIRRGRFNAWGTVVGALLLAVGESGLDLMGAPTWVPYVFDGGALLLSVGFAVLVARRLGRYENVP